MSKQLPAYTGRQIIFVGTNANDGTGDTLRNAFIKTNDNFDVLYGIAGLSAGFKFSKLYETPETYVANTLVTVNEFADGLVYRTAVSDDIEVTITEDQFNLQLAPILANNISFMGDTVFNGEFSINTHALNLAASAVDFAAADGAGLYIGGANANLKYQSGFDSWASNKSVLPTVTSQIDLGAQTRKWNNLWVNDIHANTIVGTLTGTVSSISNHNSDELAEGQTNRYYTVARENNMKTYVGDAITNLVNGAPGVLDTLDELAAALGDDANFATTVATQIATAKTDINANVNAVSANLASEVTRAMAAEAALVANVTATFTSTASTTDAALALKANTANVSATFASTAAATAAALALKANISSLATVATTGSYNDLLNKPTVGSLTNDSNYQTAAQVAASIQAVVGAAPAALDTLAEIAAQLSTDENAVAALTGVVASKASTADVNTALALKANVADVNSSLALKANISSLANVATTGSYTDLLNKPTIPAAQVNSNWASTSGVAQILNKPVYISSITASGSNLVVTKSDSSTTNVAMATGPQGPTGATGAAGPSTYDVHNFVNGKPIVNEVLMRFIAIRAFTCPINFGGSLAYCTTPATASFVINILKNSATVGTLTYAAGSRFGTFSSSSALVCSVGDQIALQCLTAVQDQSLSDLTISIFGTTT